MRIVAVADTHLWERDLVVPEGDVFVHAGDMLRSGRLAELPLAAEWIRGLPHPYKIVVAGNHDWCFQLEKEAALELLGDGVIYLEDSGVTIAGVRFWGSPWQPEFCNWAFNLPRGKPLADKWALIPEATDVLVTHGPPHGYGDRTADGRREGCEDLLGALDRVRPALHVFGHIHEDGGAWWRDPTRIANVTTAECERGASVFDLDAATKDLRAMTIPRP